MSHVHEATVEAWSHVVVLLSAEIAKELRNSPPYKRTEYSLRRELTACILGSQVRYEHAVAATERLDREGLLSDEAWCCQDSPGFEEATAAALRGGTNEASYRFPQAKARQLAETRLALAEKSLSRRISEEVCPRRLRRELVADIPGLGPKQSSMFLRNVGVSYDLAVLDTHVVRYIVALGLSSSTQVRVDRMSSYEAVELVLDSYAVRLGYPVGYVDVAIWATMKAYRELRA